MRSLNPFTGEFYREALQVSRWTREMFCLMEGRHVHPSTLYPGGVGTVATIQLMTDYMTRLMRYVEFMKKVVPMHDDLFDFFYEALPGYEKVGLRRTLLGCWGSFQDPDVCNFAYKDMEQWGNAMFVTPGVVVDGKLVTHSLVDINLGIRILLGSSYYDDWTDQEMFVKTDPLGNPVDRRHPWNQHTNPRPQKRDMDDKYSWVMSPRWFDGKDHLALDTGGGPLARLWSTALAGLVDIGYVKATGHSVQDQPAQDRRSRVRSSSSGRSPSTAATRSNATGPAPTSRPTRRRARCTSPRRRWSRSAPGAPRRGRSSTVPDEAIGCGFTEAVRGVLSHHMVIRDGKIANYHPYPPTPWNANPRDSYGTPGPYEDAVQGQPIFEENDRENFKGIDIMRTVRSFDPCLPCGVHMYLGDGKTLEKTALANAVRHRGVMHGRSCRANPEDSTTKRSGARRAIGSRPCWTPARRAGRSRANAPSSWSARWSTSTAPGWNGCIADRRRRRSRRWSSGSPPTTWWPACCWCTACTRTTCTAGSPMRWTACGPTSARTAATSTLLEVDASDGVVRLQFAGSCKSCPSSAVTLELTVEDAVRAAAPEITSIEVVAAEADSGRRA